MGTNQKVKKQAEEDVDGVLNLATCISKPTCL